MLHLGIGRQALNKCPLLPPPTLLNFLLFRIRAKWVPKKIFFWSLLFFLMSENYSSLFTSFRLVPNSSLDWPAMIAKLCGLLGLQGSSDGNLRVFLWFKRLALKGNSEITLNWWWSWDGGVSTVWEQNFGLSKKPWQKDYYRHLLKNLWDTDSIIFFDIIQCHHFWGSGIVFY